MTTAYDEVLKNLEEKKRVIDRAIESLRALGENGVLAGLVELVETTKRRNASARAKKQQDATLQYLDVEVPEKVYLEEIRTAPSNREAALMIARHLDKPLSQQDLRDEFQHAGRKATVNTMRTTLARMKELERVGRGRYKLKGIRRRKLLSVPHFVPSRVVPEHQPKAKKAR